MKNMTHAPHTKIQLLLIMVISLDHNYEELQPLPYFPWQARDYDGKESKVSHWPLVYNWQVNVNTVHTDFYQNYSLKQKTKEINIAATKEVPFGMT